jgi:hypothetical protein
MDKRTLKLIRWQRAKNRWEYCQLPQQGHEERFSIDHVIAKKHGGSDSPQNLAYCCLRCNLFKGTDLSGIDPDTKLVTALYNPRGQPWREHFRWDGCAVIGLTPTGRATVNLLQRNVPARIRLEQALWVEGTFDPGTD